jgi:hypothetical protein
MKTAGFGLEILSCLSNHLLSLLCYAFVDAADLVHSSKSFYSSGEDI